MATKKTVPKATASKKAVSKAVPKKKVVAKAKAASSPDKKASLQQQLAALEAQMEALNQEAVDELKLKINDTKKVLRGYELQLEELTGKAAGSPKTRRSHRASISDEELQPQLLKVLTQHGKAGMNAKQLAEQVGQDALRIRKFISGNPKVLKRVGAGPGTKFFLP